jgi:serine O-acetyltransferase
VTATHPPGDQENGICALPEDLRCCFAESGADAKLSRAIPQVLFSLRGQAVVLFRVAQSVSRLSPLLGAIVKYLSHAVTGTDIATKASIGPGLRLPHPVGVVIGADSRLGRRCTIMQGVTIGAAQGKSPKLGDHVFVGPGAKVIGGVEIGAYASIGANSVVIKDVPAHRFAVGIPAEVRRDSRHSPGTGE